MPVWLSCLFCIQSKSYRSRTRAFYRLSDLIEGAKKQKKELYRLRPNHRAFVFPSVPPWTVASNDRECEPRAVAVNESWTKEGDVDSIARLFSEREWEIWLFHTLLDTQINGAWNWKRINKSNVNVRCMLKHRWGKVKNLFISKKCCDIQSFDIISQTQMLSW